jgi:hypothetical protein
MARLIWTLILFGIGFGIYQYYPELQKKAQAEQYSQASTEAEGDSVLPEMKEDADAKGTASTSPQPKVTPGPQAGATAGTTAPATKPEVAPAAPAKPKDEYDLKYTVWPRVITTKADTQLVMAGGAGKAALPKGSKATAIADEGQTIVIAPSATSQMKGRLTVDQTDVKEQLAAAYAQFKARRLQMVALTRENARKEARHAANRQVPVSVSGTNDPDMLPASVLAKIGPKPGLGSSGVPGAVEASLKAGKCKEVAAAKDKNWGGLTWREIDGEPYWVMNVGYKASTLFGEFPAEALALIRKNQVEKWIYAGTYEPVP